MIVKLLSTHLLSFTLASLVAFSSLFASSQVYSQETRYIRDTLFVPLRSGQSYKHRIVHKGLVSGTPLTLLEVSEDEDYSRVKTQDGIEGWIQTQYLSDEPSARSQLESLNLQNAKLKTQSSELKKELNEINNKYKAAKAAVAQLSKSQQNSEQELAEIKAISANAIRLNSENQTLLQQTQELQNKVDMLTTDNQHLNDKLDNDAFLNGAFAVLIGVFITLLVPRLWPSKSSEWA
ncbi:TIGR04211 family SH3 domain-containing protein [Dasania sp. GY-MA-18]|uniref:TIGR04211 family SH3 domain-containing protein n=1 Tax=Dasania phycosphaerae TaxID=2950436 RepID=A0A9J6RNR0_9GAMM|nr:MULTISPECIES: TIGR04211 family SH3 domain-containing protein [Dasania]MCR8923343.1 TIGR04211 family SH3 domain-containing protein [Dasania sp. GY-MA-18]MCZ0865775.1 TIGR04211 family SH3 domain-containing protein [Dasania phycosphaerae]MCZ0869500.1 TIGR04211 family SH3 domain-containing protein [Dasania phycosphaerae]